MGKKKKKDKQKKSDDKDGNGIAVNLVSKQKLDQLTHEEKQKFILEAVKKGKILVLEHGLTPMEQTELIENTMKEIKQDTFIGVEMEGYGENKPSFIQKLLGIPQKPRITLIGPANLLKTVKKDNNMIQTKIIAGKGS